MHFKSQKARFKNRRSTWFGILKLRVLGLAVAFVVVSYLVCVWCGVDLWIWNVQLRMSLQIKKVSLPLKSGEESKPSPSNQTASRRKSPNLADSRGRPR